MQLISCYPDTALADRHVKVLNDSGEVIGHIHYLEGVNAEAGYQYCPIKLARHHTLDLLDSIQAVLISDLKCPAHDAYRIVINFRKLISRGTPCPAQ